jgi:hypothetical protein
MAETSVQYTFPQEEPAAMDFTLWNEAITLLCSGSTILPRALGAFCVQPHLPMVWYTDCNSSILYYTGGEDTPDSYQVYIPRDHRITIRYGQKFDWSSSVIGPHPGTHYASVLMISDSCAELHSTAPYLVAPIPPVSFKDVLLSYGHIGLWEHMSVDGDGEWIREGITNDGSSMSTDSTTLCSAGVVVLCTTTKQWLKASLAEWSLCASNYRGELLGALMALLILQAASSQLPPKTNTVVLHCDNRGVNSHGNSRLRSLPKKPCQSYLSHKTYLSNYTGPSEVGMG